MVAWTSIGVCKYCVNRKCFGKSSIQKEWSKNETFLAIFKHYARCQDKKKRNLNESKIIKGLCQSAKLLLIVGKFGNMYCKKTDMIINNKKVCTYLTSHSFFLKPFKSYLYGVWELRATILTLTQTKNGSANDLMMTLKLHFESHSISKMSWHFSYYRIQVWNEKQNFFEIQGVQDNFLKLRKVRC